MEFPPTENSYSVEFSDGLVEGASDAIALIWGDNAERKCINMKDFSLKQILILFIGILLLLAGYSALFGEYGFVALRKAERRSEEYIQRVEQLKKENLEIRNEIRALKKDPTAIEKIAREELGLIGEGEIKMSPAKQHEDPTKAPLTSDSHP